MSPSGSHPVRIAAPQSQRGFVLAVALIFILILVILGLSTMRNTVLDERMAGNTMDRNLALQGAEAALRDAETFIRTQFNTLRVTQLPAQGTCNDSAADAVLFS